MALVPYSISYPAVMDTPSGENNEIGFSALQLNALERLQADLKSTSNMPAADGGLIEPLPAASAKGNLTLMIRAQLAVLARIQNESFVSEKLQKLAFSHADDSEFTQVSIRNLIPLCATVLWHPCGPLFRGTTVNSSFLLVDAFTELYAHRCTMYGCGQLWVDFPVRNSLCLFTHFLHSLFSISPSALLPLIHAKWFSFCACCVTAHSSQHALA